MSTILGDSRADQLAELDKRADALREIARTAADSGRGDFEDLSRAARSLEFAIGVLRDWVKRYG